MQKANIQIQDISGRWITISTVVSQDQIIKNSIDAVQKSYKKTVRAVDSNGNMLQLSPYVKS